MNEKTLRSKIDKLLAEKKKHDELYYKNAEPVITDFEYDMLVRELQELIVLLPEGDRGSELLKVGDDLSQGAKTIAHKERMISLENAYSLEELENWWNKLSVEHGYRPALCLELKIDGFGINLFYSKGVLQYASTRGDGRVGEDVTLNFKTIAGVPHRIDYQEDIEIRGEIYLPISEFLRINEERISREEKPFANPRNAAAGSIKLKDPAMTAERPLRALFYTLGMHPADIPPKNQKEVLNWLDSLGFPVADQRCVCSDFERVSQFCNEMEIKRYEFDFEIDGVVAKVNDNSLHRRIGETAKSPKWAIAYKFKPEEKETELIDVEYQVGRTGAVVPVAILKPVYISGSTVSRSTLHNFDEIRRLDLHYHDTVKLIKSGEIIPKILSADASKRKPDDRPIELPTHCPVCKSPLFREEDGAINYCSSSECPAQLARRIEHFASKDAMDIVGLGPANVALFLDSGIISGISDIYDIDYEKVASISGMGNKSANNLEKAIDESKTMNFDRVLFALGIRNIGIVTAGNLAKHFGNIEALRDADLESLSHVPDIGPKIARAIISYFENPINLELIDELREFGLSFEYASEQRTDLLNGKSFLITGTLPNYGRKEMETMIQSHGGKILSGVSKSLDYLVLGEKPGSKLTKAEKLGTVQIISEEELLKLLGEEK
ncbi:MAG: NAD-dependent DNA ligase LigA [Candidatus Cloacimonetes bacterium]|jgi:DNA ligase (NAD+)|nr:NAD-dependent DNA ligase LigA [Candidatus Cloacimonadota bacterium]